MNDDSLQGLIEFVVKSLVDNPDQVSIRRVSAGEHKVRYELRVAKEDMGRVIGKRGRVANSIRQLLNVAAARQGKQASLDVIDPL